MGMVLIVEACHVGLKLTERTEIKGQGSAEALNHRNPCHKGGLHTHREVLFKETGTGTKLYFMTFVIDS